MEQNNQYPSAKSMQIARLTQRIAIHQHQPGQSQHCRSQLFNMCIFSVSLSTTYTLIFHDYITGPFIAYLYEDRIFADLFCADSKNIQVPANTRAACTEHNGDGTWGAKYRLYIGLM